MLWPCRQLVYNLIHSCDCCLPQDLMKQIDDLQRQVDETEKVMREEREAHELTRDELEVMRGQLQEAETALENARQEAVVAVAAASTNLATQAEQLKKVGGLDN